MDTEYHNGPAGKLRHLVVDPASDSITHLVVDAQQHFGIPVLVPIDNVVEAGPERIRLRCSRAQLQQMDPYEEVMTSGVDPQSGMAGTAGMTGMAGMAPPLIPASGISEIAAAGFTGPLGVGPAIAPITEEVVPRGEVVIDRDSVVQASDGDVGHVEDVVTDPDTGRLAHLVVRSGHLWAAHTFRLPASAVEKVEEGSVRLRLTQAEVEAIARQADTQR
jgi:sporulation protein YlmC with PRC-barrel domain